MDLMSRHSPCSSVSPPISPIKLFNQPSLSLPPLKTLPVWNRPGLEKNRFIRSITKDSPELGRTELLLSHLTSKGTQTSPPGSAMKASSFQFSGQGLNFIDKSASQGTSDKRLYFIQSEHEHVLEKLHGEIDKLKSENKDLTFKFVMTKNGISVSPDGKGQSYYAVQNDKSAILNPAGRRNSLEREVRRADSGKEMFSKDEAKKTRPTFKSGGMRNPLQLEQHSQNIKSGSKSAKHLADQSHKHGGHLEKLAHHLSFESETSMNLPNDDNQHSNIATKEIGSSAVMSENRNKYGSDDYEEIIRGLQRLNARQANELNHLRDKLTEQRTKPDDINMYPENRLPKLAIRNTSKSAKMPPVLRGKHEILTLPALRPQKVGNRQRRAQGNHVQRQKPNKEYVQKLT